MEKPCRITEPSILPALPRPPFNGVPKCHITSQRSLQGWWLHCCPGLLVPAPGHRSSEEMFPKVQSKPALVHMRLIPLILPLVSHEKTPTHTWPPPFSPGEKITLKVVFSKPKVSFSGEARSRTNPPLSPHPSGCQNVFFYGFLLFPYLHSTIPSALDAFITTVMNPAFKITVSLISRLSSEPENQDSKCNGNFGISPLLIGFPPPLSSRL